MLLPRVDQHACYSTPLHEQVIRHPLEGPPAPTPAHSLRTMLMQITSGVTAVAPLVPPVPGTLPCLTNLKVQKLETAKKQ